MAFLKEFKSFALRGNVLDLAVGVIIGAAFGKIVSSLVEDVITPLLLTPALRAVGAQDIAQLSWNGVKYGSFLSAVISFLCIAFVLFLLIRGVNRFKKSETEAADKPSPAPSETEKLLTEIRDELRRKP